MSHKILLVDDDERNLDSTKKALVHLGYEVDITTNPAQALEDVKAKPTHYALAIVDQHMTTMLGTQFARELKTEKIPQQVLIYSCDNSTDLVKESWKSGAVDFIDKEAPTSALLKAVRSFCIRYDELIRPAENSPSANSELISSVGMIGQSEKLAHVCRQVLKFAPYQQTVLINGETGVGKELVAKAIHNESPRAKRKFIAVNCGALPENLVESTLFGHVRGAFTGATNTQQGKFLLADGGTLFLDEIGELSLEVQVKLLRVLQEKVIEPIGSKDSIKVDVRIIAATHRDLKKMVSERQFREDLYHRLNALEIKVPSLRERPDDIEPLVHFFTEDFCRETNRRISFLKSAVRVLAACEWRGNIRELKNVVEKHLAMSENDVVKKEDLQASLFEHPAESAMTWEQLEELAKKKKREYLEGVLARSKNKAEAAEELGWSRQYFHKVFKSLSETKEA